MKCRAFRPGLAALLVGMTLLGVTWGTGQDAALAVNRTLTISSFPVAGVPITLVVDGGAPEIVTTVDVEYLVQGTPVSLTAPETFQHRAFVAWWVDGPNEYSTERTIAFDLTSNKTFIAAYDVPKYKLSVTSSPEVGIEFLNEDITLLVTPYEREFDIDPLYEAIINAPVIYNGKPFSQWLLNGEEASTLHVINVIMDDDYTLEAQYGSGSIMCKIQPKAARRQARWRVDDGEWLKRGVTVTNLRVGKHKVEWKPVAGYTTPNPRMVPVEDADSLTIRGRYFPAK